MEKLLAFEIHKLTNDGKLIETYKIYINGDVEGLNTSDGSRYGISNHFPSLCREAGISMRAFSPNMDTRDA